MKRLSKVLTLLFVVFLLAGCAKESVHMNISKSGKIDLTIIEAYSSSAASYGYSVSSEDKEKYKSLGYKVEDYTEEDLTGVKATKSFDIKDVSSKDAKKVQLNDLITKENIVLFQETGKNTYKANFVFDTSSGYDSSMSGSASSFNISYSVTLPNAPKSHNADKVEGNTLTWNITYGEAKDINYEFSISGSSMIWIIIAIVAVAAIAIVIVVVVMNNKNKQNPTGNVSTDGTPVPPTIPNTPVGYPNVPMDGTMNSTNNSFAPMDSTVVPMGNSTVPMDNSVAQNYSPTDGSEQSNMGQQQ